MLSDREGLLDLPRGFSYQVISRVGEEMADGLLLPGEPDGMAAFAGPDGLTVLMRNHEQHAPGRNPFDQLGERLDRVDKDKLYDLGGGESPIAGGVSTLVYDTRKKKTVRQFLSLGGTTRNCAGGPTPWGSWITCEESTESPTHVVQPEYPCKKEHGYAFDVPASAEPTLQQAEPLRAMGRFRREAVAVDPRSGIVYQTEDLDDGAFYRFLPNEQGNLRAGGRLQALAVKKHAGLDTRNWDEQLVDEGAKFSVEWIDLDDPESPNDDLRYRAYDAGAARFARGEGIWWINGAAYFACTSGGSARIGQLWRLDPAGGELQLWVEPNNSSLIHNADNLTVSPWGDVIVCEDRQGDVVRLVGVTPRAGSTRSRTTTRGGRWRALAFPRTARRSSSTSSTAA